jgi:hypothetical protein
MRRLHAAEKLSESWCCVHVPSAAVGTACRDTQLSQHCLPLPAQDLSGGDQAAVLWALARLGHFPGGHWLAAWLSDSSCQLGDMHQMQLGTCLWALARFKYRPPEEWLQAYWAGAGMLGAASSGHVL